MKLNLKRRRGFGDERQSIAGVTSQASQTCERCGLIDSAQGATLWGLNCGRRYFEADEWPLSATGVARPPSADGASAA